MSDRDRALLDRIATDLRTVQWLEPAEIRSRARRRTLRTVSIAAVAVFAVVTSVAGLAVPRLADGWPPAPASSGSAGPSVGASRRPSAEVPREALLQEGDLPTRGYLAPSSAGFAESIVVDPFLDACLAQQGEPMPRLRSRYSRDQQLLERRPASITQPPGRLLLDQEIYRVHRDEQSQVFALLDSLDPRCRQWHNVFPVERAGKKVMVEHTAQWDVIDRGFAGDESMLVRYDPGQPRNQATKEPFGAQGDPALTLVIRVDDLVTVVTGDLGASYDDIRQLARTAAARMCVAADPAC